MSAAMGASPLTAPVPHVTAPKTRQSPKPCVATHQVACLCAVCHELIAGRVHIATDDLKLTALTAALHATCRGRRDDDT